MKRAMLPHPPILGIIHRDLNRAIRYWYGTKMSSRNHHIPIAKSQHQVINTTNASSTFNDGVKHRLHISGRAADNAEHFGRRRLGLQCLAQFCIALLEFFEEPDVLDGDDSLGCEGRNQLDLLIGEGLDFCPPKSNHADDGTFPQHWNSKDCSDLFTPLTLSPTVFRICQDVLDLNYSPLK